MLANFLSGPVSPIRYGVIVAVLILLCSACSKVDDPIVVGTDSPDRDLADYLEEMIQSARAMDESALVRGRLAMAYDVNGLREAALATYEQAEALDPSDFRWPYYRAAILAEMGDHALALAVLDRALAIDGDYTSAWLWRGSWLLKTEQPDDALNAFKRATELEGGLSADFGRAQALIAKGQHAQAIEILEPLSKISPHPQLHRTYGEALRSMGRPEEARQALAKGKTTEPLTWPDKRRDQRNVHIRGHASFQLAQTLSASGRADEALTILKRLQTYHPELLCGGEEGVVLACNLINSSSIAFDRSGLPQRGLETVQRGLDLNAEYIPFHLTIATLYRQRGDITRALTHIDRAIELNPARGYAHEQRGRLLFGLTRYDDAKTAFETALRLEPEKRMTFFYLGLTEVERGRWPDALGRFQDVVRVDPDFALGYVFLARSLGELDRVNEAHQALRDATYLGADPREVRATERRLRELDVRDNHK